MVTTMTDYYPRAALKADQLYFFTVPGQFFYTPDGVGGYWYESEAAAFEQHGRRAYIQFDGDLSDF